MSNKHLYFYCCVYYNMFTESLPAMLGHPHYIAPSLRMFILNSLTVQNHSFFSSWGPCLQCLCWSPFGATVLQPITSAPSLRAFAPTGSQVRVGQSGLIIFSQSILTILSHSGTLPVFGSQCFYITSSRSTCSSFLRFGGGGKPSTKSSP
jgi:hypothetical protein